MNIIDLVRETREKPQKKICHREHRDTGKSTKLRRRKMTAFAGYIHMTIETKQNSLLISVPLWLS